MTIQQHYVPGKVQLNLEPPVNVLSPASGECMIILGTEYSLLAQGLYSSGEQHGTDHEMC